MGPIGAKRGFSRKNVFFTAWARIPGENPLFEEGRHNWGPKGGFRKNGFFVAWARIPGERPLFEEGRHNWGIKRAIFQKCIF